MELQSSGPRRSKEQREAGFTLIELSFVALLLALLSGIIYGTVITMVRTKNALEDRRISERTAQALLTRLSRELENRQSEPLKKNKQNPSGNAAAATSGGDDDSESVTLLLGRSRRAGGVDTDSIRFTTLGSSASSDLGNPGLIEVEYRLEPQASGQAFALVREEVPAAVDDQRAADQRRFKAILSNSVKSLQFRYRSNRKWVNQWSAKRETFPDSVEITLGLQTQSGGLDTYRTAVLLYRQEEG